jgi:hypothetical protein
MRHAADMPELDEDEPPASCTASVTRRSARHRQIRKMRRARFAKRQQIAQKA